MFGGVVVDQVQEVFAVTIAASGREHRDARDADVFSWTELPELLAAEDLFDACGTACGALSVSETQDGASADDRLVAARDDEDADDEDDDFEDEEDEEDDDEDEEVDNDTIDTFDMLNELFPTAVPNSHALVVEMTNNGYRIYQAPREDNNANDDDDDDSANDDRRQ